MIIVFFGSVVFLIFLVVYSAEEADDRCQELRRQRGYYEAPLVKRASLGRWDKPSGTNPSTFGMFICCFVKNVAVLVVAAAVIVGMFF